MTASARLRDRDKLAASADYRVGLAKKRDELLRSYENAALAAVTRSAARKDRDARWAALQSVEMELTHFAAAERASQRKSL